MLRQGSDHRTAVLRVYDKEENILTEDEEKHKIDVQIAGQIVDEVSIDTDKAADESEEEIYDSLSVKPEFNKSDQESAMNDEGAEINEEDQAERDGNEENILDVDVSLEKEDEGQEEIKVFYPDRKKKI